MIRQVKPKLEMGSKTILIALPCGPREKLPLPPRVPAFSRTLDNIKIEIDEDDYMDAPKSRKRRLENLSMEEKILRK
jgi:hypothetical protein